MFNLIIDPAALTVQRELLAEIALSLHTGRAITIDTDRLDAILGLEALCGVFADEQRERYLPPKDR